EGQERRAERRRRDALAQRIPVDLLAERAGELQNGPVVGLLLGHREKLGREDVLDRGDEQRLRDELDLLGALEVALVDRPARGAEDQVDQDVAVPRLEEPSLRRPLRAKAG